MNINYFIERLDIFLNKSRKHSTIQIYDNKRMSIEVCFGITEFDENNNMVRFYVCYDKFGEYYYVTSIGADGCTEENGYTYVKLSQEDLIKIRDEINKHLTEGDLRREVSMNIKTKMEINSYEGSRHKKGLPVRGQRTNRNARTRKGKGKTVANKKKV